MGNFEKLLDLFSELDDYASYIKIGATELKDMEGTESAQEQKEIDAFIVSATKMNKRLTELIEGEDSAYDIVQKAKGESIDG